MSSNDSCKLIVIEPQDSPNETTVDVNGNSSGNELEPAMDNGARRTSLALSAHCHDDAIEEIDTASQSRRKLMVTSGLCLAFMAAEFTGGYLSSSLAIMTDALHLLTDLIGFIISMAAITLAKRPATRSMTFGWYRAEVLGAFVSILLVWAITAILVFLAIERIVNNQYEIEAQIMLITSSLGVAINLVMSIQLQHGGHGHSHGIGGGHGHSHGGGHGHSHGASVESHSHTLHNERHSNEGVDSLQSQDLNQSHSQKDYGSFEDVRIDRPDSEGGHSDNDIERPERQADINVRAAVIHILGDLGQSTGVMLAALIIYFNPALKVADPVCTFVFSVVVLITTVTIMRDIFNILMEGVPRHVDFQKMTDDLLNVDGVKSVHNLRIWALTATKVAASAHIAFSDEESSDLTHDQVLQQCRRLMFRRYGITDLTLQVEQHTQAMDDCGKCQPPPHK